MFFGPANDRSSQDHKLCHYRCDCGRTEFKIQLEKGDRKLRRWCKICKKFIYPVAVTQIKTTQRELRTTIPSWRR